MSFNLNNVNGARPASGNFNAIAAGTIVGGNAFPMADGVEPGTFCAEVTTLAETSTLTLTPLWQVSRDGGTTWITVAPTPAGGTYAAQSTGTGGADTPVTRAIPAPDVVYAYPLVRMAIQVGVTTGATGDTYAISYSYQRPSFNG